MELEEAPPAIQGHVSLNGESYPIVLSQPMRHGFRWDSDGTRIELSRFCLSGLDHGARSSHPFRALAYPLPSLQNCSAQWSDKPPPSDFITSVALRAPEVILGAGFDVKVDIWALGCIVRRHL
jgi:serine/threonine-protein kinase SRPK3